MMEAEARDLADASFGTAVLKPGAIYGTRYTAGGTPVPLWVAMAPASVVLRNMPSARARPVQAAIRPARGRAPEARELP